MRVVKSWLPVVLWAALMFCLSTGLGAGGHTRAVLLALSRWFHFRVTAAEIDQINHLVRKGAHLTEYAVLAVLSWRALALPGGCPGWGWNRRTLGEAFLLAVAFAVSDEFHQLFVPTRGSSVADVAIDGTGAALGLAVAAAVWACRGRRPTSS